MSDMHYQTVRDFRGVIETRRLWRTFLENHLRNLVSVDFFTVPAIRFEILHVFLVLVHERRRIVHFAGAAYPAVRGQLTSFGKFPSDSAPQCLLRDRDRIFGHEFVEQVKAWESSKHWELRVRLGSGPISSA